MHYYPNLSFILYSTLKLLTYLPLTIDELSTLKQVRFFWPTLYH